ncbi:MAG: hypothetical protein ABMA26_14960 [Limisphaerales bacterium]
MKTLHSPDFEAGLATRVREVCRKRRADLREHQRGKSLARRELVNKGGSLVLVTVLPAVSMLLLVNFTDGLRVPLFVLAMFGWWFGSGFVNLLRQRLITSSDALALRNLPILDSQVFAFQWQRLTWSQGAATLPSLVLGAVVVVWAGGRMSGPALAGAVLAGALAWWLGRAVGVWVVCLGWQRFAQWFDLAVVGLVLGSFMPWIGRFLHPLLVLLEPFLSLVVPTAWPGRMLADTAQHGPGVTLLLLLPTAALGWSIHAARQRLALNLQPAEPLFSLPIEAFTEKPIAQDEELDEAAFLNQPDAKPPKMRAGPTELEDYVRSRTWLAPESWSSRGWIERRVDRRLTPRERLLTEVMMPFPPTWSATWLITAKAVLLLCLGGLLLEACRFPWFGVAYLMASGPLLLFVVPLGSSLGRACGSYWAGGATFTFHTGFPIAYQEFTQLAWKIAMVRAVAALPLVMTFATFLFLKYGSPRAAWWHGPLTGLWATWFFLAARPLLSATRWSSGTSDSQRVSFWGCVAWLAAIPAFILFVMLGVLTWLATGIADAEMPHWFTLPLALAAMGISFAFQWFFGRLVARNRFDYTPGRSQSFRFTDG